MGANIFIICYQAAQIVNENKATKSVMYTLIKYNKYIYNSSRLETKLIPSWNTKRNITKKKLDTFSKLSVIR